MLSQSQDHSAAGRIMSMKNSSDTNTLPFRMLHKYKNRKKSDTDSEQVTVICLLRRHQKHTVKYFAV